MERIIKITERAATGKTKRASLKPGIYKEYNLDGKSLLVVVGEDGSWDCMPFELIEPFLNELSPCEGIPLSDLENSSKDTSIVEKELGKLERHQEKANIKTQDTVPTSFVLELVKALK